jgi:hypothetical protein
MEAKHTPGPWFSPARSFGTRYVEARIGGGLLQEVAACCPTEQPLQQEANARLIAAAPELLDALISIAEDSSDEGARECAMEAIAKATGETS